jgi:predicted negative regulator of RcsB-dependent stress response
VIALILILIFVLTLGYLIWQGKNVMKAEAQNITKFDEKVAKKRREVEDQLALMQRGKNDKTPGK